MPACPTGNSSPPLPDSPMPPPPPPAVSPTSAAAPDASLPAIASTVEGLASFSDVLADFLHQWNALLLDADSIAAALPPLADPEADTNPEPMPSPVGDRAGLLGQLNPVLAAAAASPLADRVADESNPRSPDPVAERRELSPVPAPEEDPLHQRYESNPRPDPVVEHREHSPVPAPPAARFPVAVPVPEPEPEPVLPVGLEPVRAPNPIPKPAPGRERRAGEPSAEMLGTICEQMGSRSLRGFVARHLRDRAWLRRVGPGALRLAPDPAVLVLRAVSRCYICAESENAETACVLLLELYLRAGCPRRPEAEAELRAEARVAALSWRSRIVRDKGQVADASPRDARGLILLMAGFGVPPEFPLQEFYELLLAGGCLTCVEVLRCSQLFMKKLRDVVAHMLNRGIYREAIGVILAFDLQEAFPITGVLTFIVDKVVCNRKEQESEAECDLVGSKERDEEELLLWRSISKYVEERTPCFSEMSCPSFVERIKKQHRYERGELSRPVLQFKYCSSTNSDMDPAVLCCMDL
ncbi:protein FRIGIDA [Hordeum vulgare]|nr:protein FRIGIDA [Hordeum vulgare]